MEETKERNKTNDGTDGKITVVTMRCIDGTTFCESVDKIKCSICGEMTWLPISWRNRHIDIVICGHCFKENKFTNEDYVACVTRKSLDDVLKEIRRYHKIEETDEDIRRTMLEYMEKKMRKKIIVTD